MEATARQILFTALAVFFPLGSPMAGHASGMVMAEENKRFTDKSLRISKVNSSKEYNAFDFRPSRMRLITGMAYYHHVTTPHFKNNPGDIGFVFGGSYDLKKRHSFQALASVLFSMAAPYRHSSIEISWPDDQMRKGLAESTINFTGSFQYQLGYGAIFKVFPRLIVRPSLFLGNCHIQYETRHAGYHQSDVIGPDYELVAGGKKHSGSSTSTLVNLTADVLINYHGRVSYTLSSGYQYLLSPFVDSWSYDYDNQKMSGMYDALLSGLTLRAGVALCL